MNPLCFLEAIMDMLDDILEAVEDLLGVCFPIAVMLTIGVAVMGVAIMYILALVLLT